VLILGTPYKIGSKDDMNRSLGTTRIIMALTVMVAANLALLRLAQDVMDSSNLLLEPACVIGILPLVNGLAVGTWVLLRSPKQSCFRTFLGGFVVVGWAAVLYYWICYMNGITRTFWVRSHLEIEPNCGYIFNYWINHLFLAIVSVLDYCGERGGDWTWALGVAIVLPQWFVALIGGLFTSALSLAGRSRRQSRRAE
jgi:hypothetical protein